MEAAGRRLPLWRCSHEAMWLYSYVAMWLCGYVATPKNTQRTLKDITGHYFNTERQYFDTKDIVLILRTLFLHSKTLKDYKTLNTNYPSVTLTRCLFATWVEPPSFIFLVSYSWSSFPGLIFLVLSPFRFQIPDFRFQISDSRFQISDLRFHISDFRFHVPDFRFQLSDS